MAIEFKPIWFDSMGAKSTCTWVKTPDISIVIDPGVSKMQPSFPSTDENKVKWFNCAKKSIRKACNEAEFLSISHYHYDHYFPEDISIYNGKKIFIKNPNEFINNNQRERAQNFFQKICKTFSIGESDKIYPTFSNKKYSDPIDFLPHSANKDFKTYNKRRMEVLAKGRKRFDKQVARWLSFDPLPEIESKKIKMLFPEEKSFHFGDTVVKFTSPLFHGIEYANVGWVYSVIIEYKGEKLMHSSDLCGPMIEDYADMIIRENPSVLLLDGPTTYLFGYILNKINLDRTVKNTVRILNKIDTDLIIYDHHLARESKFRERTKEVWETAKKLDKKVLTAAEYLGRETVVELE